MWGKKKKKITPFGSYADNGKLFFAVFAFKIDILIVLKFEQYQEAKQNGLVFELKPALLFLKFRS